MTGISYKGKTSRAPQTEPQGTPVDRPNSEFQNRRDGAKDPKDPKGPSWKGPKKYLSIDAEDISQLESLIDNQTTLIQRIENGDKLGAGAIAAHTQQVLAYSLHRVTGKHYECSKEAWEAMERSYWHGVLKERGEL